MSEPIRVTGVSRVADNDKVLLVGFDRRPTDDELRAFHDRSRLPPRQSGAEVDAVLSALPASEIFRAAQVIVPDLTRKKVYNALGYLCRRGNIVRIGFGKFQRPPDFAKNDGAAE